MGAFAKETSTRESGEITCLIPDNETYVILRGDIPTGIHHLTVWGPAEREVAQELSATFDAYTLGELLRWWDRAVSAHDVDDKVDAVLFLGVGAPSTHDDEIAERLRIALCDPDKDVRNAAIVAVEYADWSVFAPELEAIAARDPDEIARARARAVLDYWHRDGRA
jgi:hypothetical protein